MFLHLATPPRPERERERDRNQTLRQQLSTPSWHRVEPAGRVLLALQLEQDDDVELGSGFEFGGTTSADGEGGEGGEQEEGEESKAQRLPPSRPVDVTTRPVESLSPADVGGLLDALELGRYREEIERAGRDGAWLASCCAGAGAGAGAVASAEAGDTALRDAGVSFGAHREKLRRAVALMMQQGGVPRSMVERSGSGGSAEQGDGSSFFGSFF